MDSKSKNIQLESTESVEVDKFAPFKRDLEVINQCKDQDLKSALILNRKKKYALQSILNRMNVHKQKLQLQKAECRTYIVNESKNVQTSTTSCVGMPYFKDKEMCPSPHNTDYLKMQENNELVHQSYYIPRVWSPCDKTKLAQSVYKYITNEKQDEVKNKLKNQAIFETLTLEDIEKLQKELIYLQDKCAIVHIATNWFSAKILTKDELEKHKNHLNQRITQLETVFFQRKYESEAKLNIVKQEYAEVELRNYIISTVASWTGNIDWRYLSTQDGLRQSDLECKFMWDSFINPKVNKRPWTSEETEKLVVIVNENNMENWEVISDQLGLNKSAYQCCNLFFSKLWDSYRRTSWSKDEEVYLNTLVKRFQVGSFIPWEEIAKYFNERSKYQIHKHYTCMQLKDFKKVSFTLSEDILLIALIKYYNSFIGAIDFFPNRTIEQIRNRYLTIGFQARDWTHEEDIIILKHVEKYGQSKWDKIRLIDRCQSSVCHRYSFLKNWIKEHPYENIINVPRKKRESVASNLYLENKFLIDKIVKQLLQEINNGALPENIFNLKYIERILSQTSVKDLGEVKTKKCTTTEQQTNRTQKEAASSNSVIDHQTGILSKLTSQESDSGPSNQLREPLKSAKNDPLFLSRRKNGSIDRTVEKLQAKLGLNSVVLNFFKMQYNFRGKQNKLAQPETSWTFINHIKGAEQVHTVLNLLGARLDIPDLNELKNNIHLDELDIKILQELKKRPPSSESQPGPSNQSTAPTQTQMEGIIQRTDLEAGPSRQPVSTPTLIEEIEALQNDLESPGPSSRWKNNPQLSNDSKSEELGPDTSEWYIDHQTGILSKLTSQESDSGPSNQLREPLKSAKNDPPFLSRRPNGSIDRTVEKLDRKILAKTTLLDKYGERTLEPQAGPSGQTAKKVTTESNLKSQRLKILSPQSINLKKVDLKLLDGVKTNLDLQSRPSDLDPPRLQIFDPKSMNLKKVDLKMLYIKRLRSEGKLMLLPANSYPEPLSRSLDQTAAAEVTTESNLDPARLKTLVPKSKVMKAAKNNPEPQAEPSAQTVTTESPTLKLHRDIRFAVRCTRSIGYCTPTVLDSKLIILKQVDCKILPSVKNGPKLQESNPVLQCLKTLDPKSTNSRKVDPKILETTKKGIEPQPGPSNQSQLTALLLNQKAVPEVTNTPKTITTITGFSFYIPPNIETLIGYRSLMIYLPDLRNYIEQVQCTKYNESTMKILDKQIFLLDQDTRINFCRKRDLFEKRVTSLFKWPALMSLPEKKPVGRNNYYTKPQEASNKVLKINKTRKRKTNNSDDKKTYNKKPKIDENS